PYGQHLRKIVLHKIERFDYLDGFPSCRMRTETATRRSLMRRLLTPKDAGALLGLSTGRIQQLDREGRLRAIRDSAGRRLFREGDVLRFKAERDQRARAQAGGRSAAR